MLHYPSYITTYYNFETALNVLQILFLGRWVTLQLAKTYTISDIEIYTNYLSESPLYLFA